MVECGYNAFVLPSPKGAQEGESMPQSLANVLLHVVFGTKGRDPVLANAWRPEKYRALLKKHGLAFDERHVWD
jgi:hypothetical protein